MNILRVGLPELINTAGYFGIFAIIFAESGLFVGFFLPGDSFLFTAGFLASQGILNIFILVPICFVAAILGDNFGYFFGRKIGPALFTKERSIFFHKENLERARIFYENYGAKTIFLARFLPIIRTFAPILAGVGKMQYKTFMIYNLIGAFIWGVGITLFGYYLGSVIPQAEDFLIYIVAAIIALSALPSLIHVIRNRETFFPEKK